MASAKTTLEGVVWRVNPEQLVGQNKDLRQRTLVIRADDGQYHDLYHVEFLKDKCDELNGIQAGLPVSIECYIKGREWTPQGKPIEETKNFITFRPAGPLRTAAAPQQPAQQPAGTGGGYF